MKIINLKMRVCHFPQVPCDPFVVECDNEYEANLIVNTLANQHLFLYDNNIITDYSNAILVEMKNPETDKWEDYFNEDEVMEWDEYVDTYLTEIKSYTEFLKAVVGF